MTGQTGSGVAAIIGIAALVGVVGGVGSVAMTSQGRSSIAHAARVAAVAGGLKRRRSPASGDYWPGCNEARDAGTAPIYRDEPGYRTEMDGDGDGIACEPIRS